MNQRFIDWLLILFVTALVFPLSANGWAQELPESWEGFGLSRVLSMGGVAEELEMTEEQTNSLMDLWLEVQDRIQREKGSIRRQWQVHKSDEAKLDSVRKSFVEKLNGIRKFEQETIEKVLLPHQVKRLEQIRFQRVASSPRGATFLQQELKLSEKQVERAKDVGGQFALALRNAARFAKNKGLSRYSFQKQQEKMTLSFTEKLLGILNPEQREALKQMQGEPFAFRMARTQQSSPNDEKDWEDDWKSFDPTVGPPNSRDR